MHGVVRNAKPFLRRIQSFEEALQVVIVSSGTEVALPPVNPLSDSVRLDELQTR